MSYANAAPQAEAQYEKVDRKVFTGRITKDLVLNETQNGNSVLNIDFAMDIKALETGTQFARITLWGEEAQIASHFLSKGDNIVGSGVVKWEEWNNNGKSGRNLIYDYPTIHFNLEQLKEFIRMEIGIALQNLNGVQEPDVEETVPETQPAPQPDVEEEFGDPTLDLQSADLPF